MIGGFMRPNTAKIERKVPGAPSLTGEKRTTVQQIYAALPCRTDPVPVSSKMGGNLDVTVEGVVYIQTDTGYVDGVGPSYFVGKNPGDSITVKGQTYIVAANGRAAFPDVNVSDRWTTEDGRAFLVLAVARYSDVLPNMQVRLSFGRSW